MLGCGHIKKFGWTNWYYATYDQSTSQEELSRQQRCHPRCMTASSTWFCLRSTYPHFSWSGSPHISGMHHSSCRTSSPSDLLIGLALSLGRNPWLLQFLTLAAWSYSRRIQLSISSWSLPLSRSRSIHPSKYLVPSENPEPQSINQGWTGYIHSDFGLAPDLGPARERTSPGSLRCYNRHLAGVCQTYSYSWFYCIGIPFWPRHDCCFSYTDWAAYSGFWQYIAEFAISSRSWTSASSASTCRRCSLAPLVWAKSVSWSSSLSRWQALQQPESSMETSI